MHPGTVRYQDEVEQTDAPRFDDGVRGDVPRSGPTRGPHVERESGGWDTVEIEDGARLFFGELGER
jgi:hypothetical protein